MRARAGRCFEHAGAQALAAHFHQTEARDAPDLDPRTIILERVLHRFLDFAIVVALLHVDEVDHHQPGHVAQAQLTGDFVRCLDVGRERGLLDAMFFGRAARVDVDRHQGFGRVDHQVTARLQLDHRLVHRRQRVLDAVTLEDRGRVGIGLDAFDVARHQQLHEAAGGLVALLALDQDLVDFLVIQVADRALDQVAVAINQGGCRAGQCLLADFIPQAGEIIEIAANLDLGPLETGGADNQAHHRRQVEVGHDRLQPLAICAIGDFARDPATVAGVGHQHAIAAGERQVGGQRGALVTAFFLDDLNQQHLAALDDVLDLVAAAQILALATKLVGGAFIDRRRVGAGAGLGCFAFVVVMIAFLGDVVVRSVVVMMRVEAALIFLIITAQPLFLGGMLGFFAEQGIAVRLGDLVIIGVDFAEGEEAVAIAAVIDERRLQRRFDPGYFGKIDIAFELLVFGGLEIKLFDPVTLGDGDPSFLGVARVDQHAHGH